MSERIVPTKPGMWFIDAANDHGFEVVEVRTVRGCLTYHSLGLWINVRDFVGNWLRPCPAPHEMTALESKCHQQQEAIAKLMAACECTAEDCRCGEFAAVESRKILGL